LTAYGAENIFVSTNLKYVDLVRVQLPELPAVNIIGEPARRDLAAAVGLAMMHIAHASDSEDEPIAILWGDNYMDQVETFQEVLAAAEQLLSDKKASILFVGETPRFANENLGWIGLGKELGRVGERPFYAFDSLTYRPEKELCNQFFAEKSHVWNTGYFVTTVGYIQKQYQLLQPTLWAKLQEIGSEIGKEDYLDTLIDIYPQLESISFDDAILEFIPPADAAVLHGEMGWSDPGTLYALKEAINPDLTANVTKGRVIIESVSDSLVYNYDGDKLIAVVGVEGMIVVNTEDALLVVHKDQIPLVKKMVNGLEGTDLEKYS
jgi:mannose-1-phosphate guanylyltransferase